MPSICAQYLYAEVEDVVLVEEPLDFEAQVIASMPSDFFVSINVECDYCKTTLPVDQTEATIRGGRPVFLCEHCYAPMPIL